MSMGVFMPMPAPLMGGGGGGALDGMITVGSSSALGFMAYGYSDGTVYPMTMGSLSGDAASYFVGAFLWGPAISFGVAILNDGYPGSTLDFQGEIYEITFDESNEMWAFQFGPEVATWPTSGTHPFTLTLP